MAAGELSNAPRVDELRELMGDDATQKLVEKFGGKRLYVPNRATKRAPLQNLVGEAAFLKIAKAFGGVQIFVPKNTRREIQKNAANMRDFCLEQRINGAGALQIIALSQEIHGVKLTERRVRRYLSGETNEQIGADDGDE